MFKWLCVYSLQLLNCVSNLAARDPAVEVRRAAVLLITLLLKGLDSEALQVSASLLAHSTALRRRYKFMHFSLKVLEPIIKNLYRVLKEIVLLDNDDRVVTFHANQGLEKLAEIVKGYLTAPKIAGKTVRELRLP